MKSQSKTKKISRLGKKIVVTVVIILVILGLFLLFMGRNYLKSSLKPLNSADTRSVQVKIPVGASDRKIGSILQNRRVVRNGLMFSYYVKSRNVRDLKAGYYRLSPSMSLKQVSGLLKMGGSNHPLNLRKRQLVVKPDERTADVITQLGRSGSQFKRLLADRSYVKRLAKRYPNLKLRERGTRLEPYLAPGRYTYAPSDLSRLLNQMVGKTSEQLRDNQKRIHQAHLTGPEAYRMAAYFDRIHLRVNEQRSLARLWLYNPASLHHVHFYVMKHSGKIIKRIAVNFDRRSSSESPSMTSVLAMLPNRKITSGQIYFTVSNSNRRIYGSVGSFNNLRLIDQAISHYK